MAHDTAIVVTTIAWGLIGLARCAITVAGACHRARWRARVVGFLANRVAAEVQWTDRGADGSQSTFTVSTPISEDRSRCG